MASFSSTTRQTGCMRKAVLAMICSKYVPKTDALAFGTAFHTSLEKGIRDGVLELQKAGLDDQIPLLTEMNLRQVQFMDEHNIEILAHELDFEVEFDGIDEKFVGFIDGLAMWNDEPWLLEFKTARYIDVSHVSVDSQITAYLWACRETGLCEPKGVLYFVNQKSMFKEPTVLASGHLSTAKNQGCSYESYVAKAKEIYGDQIPAKVELFMEWLKQNEQPKLVMVATRRTDEQLDEFGKTIREYVAQEDKLKKMIKELGPDEAVRQTKCFPHKLCFANCDYRDICKAIITSDDIKVSDIDEEFFKPKDNC